MARNRRRQYNRTGLVGDILRAGQSPAPEVPEPSLASTVKPVYVASSGDPSLQGMAQALRAAAERAQANGKPGLTAVISGTTESDLPGQYEQPASERAADNENFTGHQAAVAEDYFGLAGEIREKGVDPLDIAKEWDEAYRTWEQLKFKIEHYKNAKNPVEKERLLDEIQRYGDETKWQELSQKIREAANNIRNVRERYEADFGSWTGETSKENREYRQKMRELVGLYERQQTLGRPRPAPAQVMPTSAVPLEAQEPIPAPEVSSEPALKREFDGEPVAENAIPPIVDFSGVIDKESKELGEIAAGGEPSKGHEDPEGRVLPKLDGKDKVDNEPVSDRRHQAPSALNAAEEVDAGAGRAGGSSTPPPPSPPGGPPLPNPHDMAELPEAARKAHTAEEVLDGTIPQLRQSREAYDIYGGGPDMPKGWRSQDTRTEEEKMLDAELGEDGTFPDMGSEAQVKYGSFAFNPSAPAEADAEASPMAPSPMRIAQERLRDATTPEEERAAREELAKLRAEAAGIGGSRETMRTTEQKAESAEREFYRQSLLRRAAARLSGKKVITDGRRDADLSLTNTVYQHALEEHMQARLGPERRPIDEGKVRTALESKKESEKRAKIEERYRRSVIRPELDFTRSEDALARAKSEELTAKERSVISKGFAYLIDRNAALDRRFGPVGARFIRAGVFGSIAIGATFLTSPASLAVLGGVGATRAARSVLGATLGVAAAKKTGNMYERSGGTKRRGARDAAKTGTASTEEELTAMRHAYRRGDERAIAVRRRFYMALAAAAAGGATSAGFSVVELFTHGPSVTSMSEGLKAGGPGAESAGHGGVAITPEVTPGHSHPPHELSPRPSSPQNAEVPPSGIATGPVGISVEVSPGYGYENMIRDLAGKLKGHAPGEYPPGSDAYKLLDAMQKGKLNGAILEIENMKGHGFLKIDGSSVMIEKGAHLTIGADGQLHYYDSHTPDTIEAPQGARLTPAPERVAPASHTLAAPVELHDANHPSTQDLNRAELDRIAQGGRSPSAAPMPSADQLDRLENGPQATATPRMPDYQSGHPAQGINRLATESPASRTNAPTIPETAQKPTAFMSWAERIKPFTNQHGLEIDPQKADVYIGDQGLAMAYGHSYADRFAAAEAFARTHKGVEVMVEAEQPYVGPDGIPHPWVFSIKYRGLLSNIIGTTKPPIVDSTHPPPPNQMGSINPETFTAWASEHPPAPLVVT